METKPIYTTVIFTLLLFVGAMVVHEIFHSDHLTVCCETGEDHESDGHDSPSSDEGCICYCHLELLNLDNIDFHDIDHTSQSIISYAEFSFPTPFPQTLYRPPQSV